MKEFLSDENIKDLVIYRSQRARETLHEAEIMLREGCYNAAINRLYYSCFYIISALLIKNKIQAYTHSGVKQLFGLNFIANGILPKSVNTTYISLFEKRHSNDYDDFVYCDRETVEEIFPQVKELLSSIEKLL